MIKRRRLIHKTIYRVVNEVWWSAAGQCVFVPFVRHEDFARAAERGRKKRRAVRGRAGNERVERRLPSGRGRARAVPRRSENRRDPVRATAVRARITTGT